MTRTDCFDSLRLARHEAALALIRQIDIMRTLERAHMLTQEFVGVTKDARRRYSQWTKEARSGGS